MHDDFSNAMSSHDEAPPFSDDGNLDLLGGGRFEEAVDLEEGSGQESIHGAFEGLEFQPRKKRPLERVPCQKGVGVGDEMSFDMVKLPRSGLPKQPWETGDMASVLWNHQNQEAVFRSSYFAANICSSRYHDCKLTDVHHRWSGVHVSGVPGRLQAAEVEGLLMSVHGCTLVSINWSCCSITLPSIAFALASMRMRRLRKHRLAVCSVRRSWSLMEPVKISVRCSVARVWSKLSCVWEMSCTYSCRRRSWHASLRLSVACSGCAEVSGLTVSPKE